MQRLRSLACPLSLALEHPCHFAIITRTSHLLLGVRFSLCFGPLGTSKPILVHFCYIVNSWLWVPKRIIKIQRLAPGAEKGRPKEQPESSSAGLQKPPGAPKSPANEPKRGPIRCQKSAWPKRPKTCSTARQFRRLKPTTKHIKTVKKRIQTDKKQIKTDKNR